MVPHMLVLVAWFLLKNIVKTQRFRYLLVLVAWFLLINMSFRLQSLKASVFKNAIKLKRNLIREAFLKLKLRDTPQEPRIKAGTSGQAIKEKPWAWWTTAFKI